MATYRMMVPLFAEAWVDVDLKETDDDGNVLSEQELLSEATEKANLPGICAQCNGWGQTSGIELSDDADWDEAKIYKKDGHDDY